MWQSSAKMLTDIGLKDACEEIKVDNVGIAFYFSMQINVTDARGVTRIGWCLPKECTQDNVNGALDKVVTSMNKMLGMLPSFGINIDILIFTPKSKIFMHVTKSDDYVENWQANTKTGAIIIVALISVILAVSLFINIVVVLKNRKKQQEQEKYISEYTIKS